MHLTSLHCLNATFWAATSFFLFLSRANLWRSSEPDQSGYPLTGKVLAATSTRISQHAISTFPSPSLQIMFSYDQRPRHVDEVTVGKVQRYPASHHSRPDFPKPLSFLQQRNLFSNSPEPITIRSFHASSDRAQICLLSNFSPLRGIDTPFHRHPSVRDRRDPRLTCITALATVLKL